MNETLAIEYTGPRCRLCGIPTQLGPDDLWADVRYNETCCLPCAGIKTPYQIQFEEENAE